MALRPQYNPSNYQGGMDLPYSSSHTIHHVLLDFPMNSCQLTPAPISACYANIRSFSWRQGVSCIHLLSLQTLIGSLPGPQISPLFLFLGFELIGWHKGHCQVWEPASIAGYGVRTAVIKLRQSWMERNRDVLAWPCQSWSTRTVTTDTLPQGSVCRVGYTDRRHQASQFRSLRLWQCPGLIYWIKSGRQGPWACL